jgi:hypothetical protein
MTEAEAISMDTLGYEIEDTKPTIEVVEVVSPER